MNPVELSVLNSLRERIDAGEQFNATLLARYNALESQFSQGQQLFYFPP
jgi:hypothetical protein